MLKVLVVQIDDRPFSFFEQSKSLVLPDATDRKDVICSVNGNQLTNDWDYWSLSSLLNQLRCRQLGWTYERWKPELIERHCTWNKVKALLEHLPVIGHDIVVVLDSDAWIREPGELLHTIDIFASGSHCLLFGADPAISYNTKITTGCMAMKNIPRAKEFWTRVWNFPEDNDEARQYIYMWPHEQKIADMLVQEEYRADAQILEIKGYNTPCGDVIRHCWWKEVCKEMLVDEILSFCVSSLKVGLNPSVSVPSTPSSNS